MTPSAALNKITTAWDDLQTSYAGLSAEQLLEPGVVGDWSVRDILAHVTTWEQEALNALPAIRRGERLPRYSQLYGGIDAFNALMTRRKCRLALDEVLRQHAAVHADLLTLIGALSDIETASGTRLYRRLGADTWRHYPEHARSIRAWREKRGL